MRNLQQDAGSVTGVFFAALGPAMLQVDEYLKRPPYDVVGLTTGDVDNEADAARIVLELRVVQTLFGRQR